MRAGLQVTSLWVVAMMGLVEGKDETLPGFSCDLQCANGGYCTLMEGTSEEVGRQAQSGRMIEKCICPQGFTGIACDVVVEQCNGPDQLCSSGLPCTQNASGEWGCDCSIADSLSVFAGHQCRNPVTEYCSGRYEPDTAIAFCTNGGRCVGDFLAAQVAPGDTAFNRAYQHRGCKCPQEFYGPHCEFLKFTIDSNEETQGALLESNPTTANSPLSSFFTAVVVLVCMASMIMMVSLARYYMSQRRTKKVPQEIIFDHGDVIWNNLYKDYQLNGRHHVFDNKEEHSHHQRNLRIISLFDDDNELA